MRRLDEIVHRLDQLIQKGESIVVTKSYSEYGPDDVDENFFHQWKPSCLAFLKNVFGVESSHYLLFQANCEHAVYYHSVRGLAILRSAKDDLESGFLTSLANLVSADIFTDFLEMAEHLLDLGYKDPAASLIGAVLEDGLRKITFSDGITLKSKEDVSSLNQKLAQAEVYNRLTQKRIQVWNDVRNNADHGNFGEYESTDVRDMLSGVTAFLESYMM